MDVGVWALEVEGIDEEEEWMDVGVWA